MNFDGVLTQIFQPYFYYSLFFLILSYVSLKVMLRYSSFLGQKTRSLIYLVPLAIPLIVMIAFVPSTAIHINAPTIIKPTAGAINFPTVTSSSFNGFLFGSGMPPPMPPPGAFLLTTGAQSLPLVSTIFSFTGLLCIVGLAAAAFFAVSMIAADDRIARKIFRIILLSPEEHQWLQVKVAELCKKLQIHSPKIGVVEDLRPNAFTVGYGKNTTIVFSLGLFNLLSKDEIAAVASHELAHVKNHDFFYKLLSSSLTVVSFFNPLAYLASTSAQKEREMFADDGAVAVLEKPSELGNALAKICAAIEKLPKESLRFSFSSNFLVTSSVLHRVGILSTHPRLDRRLRNISSPHSCSRLNHRSVSLAALLALILVCSFVAVSFAMVDLQTGFASSQQSPAPLTPNTVGYGVVGDGFMSSSGPVIVHAASAQMVGSPVIYVGPSVNQDAVFFVVNNGSSVPQGVAVAGCGFPLENVTAGS